MSSEGQIQPESREIVLAVLDDEVARRGIYVDLLLALPQPALLARRHHQ